MVISFKGWISRLLFILLFAVLLVIASGGYRWLLDVVSPLDPYHKPRGDAMKVFEHERAIQEQGNTADRLRLFYWYGE